MRRSFAADSRVRRSLAVAAAGAIVLAACGGGSDDASDDAAPADAGAVESDDSAEGATGEAMPVRTGAGLVDLVGPDVATTAEIETNQLPDVVVDDLTNGRKVNFRNLVPQDKPILLWMYAPH